jgi:hypothetical protein
MTVTTIIAILTERERKARPRRRLSQVHQHRRRRCEWVKETHECGGRPRQAERKFFYFITWEGSGALHPNPLTLWNKKIPFAAECRRMRRGPGRTIGVDAIRRTQKKSTAGPRTVERRRVHGRGPRRTIGVDAYGSKKKYTFLCIHVLLYLSIRVHARVSQHARVNVLEHLLDPAARCVPRTETRTSARPRRPAGLRWRARTAPPARDRDAAADADG